MAISRPVRTQPIGVQVIDAGAKTLPEKVETMKFSTAQEIERLKSTHASLKGELQELRRRAYLTPSEEYRARELKKEKLKAKDRLRMLTQRATIQHD